MVDPVRVRTVDDVALVFMEANTNLDPGIERWFEALRRPEIRKSLVLAVGPISSEASRRRRTVGVVGEQGIRIVAVSDDRFNHGLVRVFSYFGLSISAFGWDQLEDAARSVAARPELVESIVREARQLHAQSATAQSLDD
jgi:hypothetical protein